MRALSGGGRNVTPKAGPRLQRQRQRGARASAALLRSKTLAPVVATTQSATRMTWARFNDLLEVFPLPKPTVRVQLWV